LPINASITVDGTSIDVQPAVEGAVLSQAGAVSSLQRAFAEGSSSTVLTVEESAPEISTAEAQRVAREVAEPAVSGPVVIRAGGAGTFTVSAKTIGKALSFTAVDQTLVPRLNAAELRDLADEAFDDLEVDKPKDAEVRIVRGRPEVIPAVDGTRLTAAALSEAVSSVLTKNGSARTASVQLSGAPAKFSTADAEKLGITEVTGKFTTRFPYATYRNVNIGRAAELINGTLLEPGETFSLNDIVGERTKANGFTEGNIISGGKFRLELGGGVSQSATTTYNAMFFAGLKDVEHRPHTLYINRYPAGREATVAWPSVDLRFSNDTDYGVLVQAKRVKATPGRQGSLTVKMWSTKTYDKVTSTKLVRSNFTTGRDVEDSSPKCQPMAPVAGFDVNYSRLFYRDQKVVKREKFSWRYNPTDRVRCT
jgi:vancomycin resistance protein YoaR